MNLNIKYMKVWCYYFQVNFGCHCYNKLEPKSETEGEPYQPVDNANFNSTTSWKVRKNDLVSTIISRLYMLSSIPSGIILMS